MSKQSSLTKTVRNFITAHGMIQTESHILIALSGGADSVCLLCVLQELQQELGIAVSALHVHHGIRGAEADRDADFCRVLCAEMEVPCQIVYVDVPAVASTQRMSLEEAARMIRYRELEAHRQQLAESAYGGDDSRVQIAVAHHREDQAETVLWNLFRGSGLKGLGGMEPVNGAVIRPLLDVSKEEILNYLQQRETPWQQDSTNASDDYTRNRIRHHILEYATEHINERSAEHICQAARLAGQAEVYLRNQARQWLDAERSQQFQRYADLDLDQGKGTVVRISRLVQEDDILQSYILRELLGQYRSLTDVTARHIEGILSLLTEMPGGSADRRMALGDGMAARRSYDCLWIERMETIAGQADEPDTSACQAVEVDLQQLVEETTIQRIGGLSEGPTFKEICCGEKIFRLRVVSCEKGKKIPTNQYTKWINYDTLERTLVFRTRRVGDYILLPGGSRKTVKSYMIDEKIPAGERDRIPVIAQGSHVLWIAGYRLSEGAKIGEDTRLALEIQMHGG